MSRWASSLGAGVVGLCAVWLFVADAGPPRALVALFDPTYTAGAPLRAFDTLLITLAPEQPPDAAHALADLLARSPAADVFDVGEHTVSVAARSDGTPAGDAAARDAIEHLLTTRPGRFEVLPIIDASPKLDALRTFMWDLRDPALSLPPTGLPDSDTEAALSAAIGLAKTGCEPCALEPHEALLVERTTIFDDHGVTHDRWVAHLVSRAPPVFDQRFLADAEVIFDDMNRAAVNVTLTAEGATRFADLSRAHIGRRLAIVIDGRVQLAPVVQSVITGGQIHIALGGRSAKEDHATATDLAARLRPGMEVPPGTTWTWQAHLGASAAAVTWATILTILGAALVAAALVTLARRIPNLEHAPVSVLRPALTTSMPVVPVALMRVLATLALAATPWWLQHVPIPGLDAQPDAGVDLSLASLGIIPVLLAHLLVSLVVAIAPPLRRHRGGSLAARRALLPATALVTLALCTLQGLAVTAYLQMFVPEAWGPSGGVVILSLAAGTFILWGAAELITRFGLGHGFVVLIVASSAQALTGMTDEVRPWIVGVLLALGASVLWLTLHRARGPRDDATRRLPLAGLVPIDLVATVFQVLVLLAPFTGWMIAPDLVGPTALAIGCALVAVLLAWAYGRPLPVSTLAAPALIGAAVLVAIVLAQSVLAAAMPMLGLSFMAMLVSLPVLLWDLGAELRLVAAVGSVARVASTHSVDEADALLAALARAGVPATLRAARYRALLRFMGPWLPIEVLVPTQRIEEARAALTAHAHADVVTPFGDAPQADVRTA